MDGVHDMGGLAGFGPINPTQDEPFSKTDWRARMFALELSYTQPGGFNVDWLRHVLECLPPDVYLTSEYFDRWYWRDAGVLANAGWVSIDELKSGAASSVPEDTGDPLPPEAVPVMLEQGLDSRRDVADEPAFKSGDRVRAKLQAPPGATRLPRYVRGHVGVVERYHGWHVLPDANALGDERPEPLYSVGFLAGELWSDAEVPGDIVVACLWESYLERE